MTKSFVVLAVIFVIVGGSIGGAFTGGVILGRSQAENETPTASNLVPPQDFAGQRAALQQFGDQIPLDEDGNPTSPPCGRWPRPRDAACLPPRVEPQPLPPTLIPTTTQTRKLPLQPTSTTTMTMCKLPRVPARNPASQASVVVALDCLAAAAQPSGQSIPLVTAS